MMKQNMFGSNNNTEINQIVLDHVNPSSMDSYLHFPDPFLDGDDLFLSHFLSQQQQFLFRAEDCWEEQEQEEQPEQQQEHDHQRRQNNTDKAATIEVVEKKTKKKKCGSNRKNGSSTKMRRTGKKDRHSKICTAQGPRDRRMRLSLQIARKFFDLQDMLGFDKASKTIEWLLSNSNSAIKDLKNTFNNNNSGFSYGSSVSCSSEVIVSEIIRDNNVANAKEEVAFLKDKKCRQLRTVARESRDRARARARERTLLKKTNQPISIISEDQNTCFNFQDENSHLQEDTNFAISDHLSEFPSMHTFSSGNNNDHTIDYSTLSCPNSIFMASSIPKPYSFSDSTLLKLP